MQSIKQIRKAFEEQDPDVVAIELDKTRLYGLLHDAKPSLSVKNIAQIGFKGYLFALVGAYIQKKLGNVVGVKPGSEMLYAFKLAQQNHKRVALIDQNINITLRKLSKSLTWRERWNFLADLFKGIILRQKIKIDLTEIPKHDLIEELLGKLEDRYPSLYRVLVAERNQIMAKRLHQLMQTYSVLGVVGAGHQQAIIDLVKKHDKP
jgi:pheromone shutdown protein TraB